MPQVIALKIYRKRSQSCEVCAVKHWRKMFALNMSTFPVNHVNIFFISRVFIDTVKNSGVTVTIF